MTFSVRTEFLNFHLRGMTFSSLIRRSASVPMLKGCSEIGKRALSRSLRDITSPQPLMFKSDYECESPVSRPGLDYGEAGVLVVRLRPSPHGRSAPTSRSEHMGRRLQEPT